MISFEEVYKLVNEASDGEAAFNKEECKALYDFASLVPPDGLVIEIGVQFGRSATVLGALAKEIGFRFIAIDNWLEDVSPQAKANVENVLIGKMGLPIELWSMGSIEAVIKFVDEVRRPISLIHIDGGHEYEEVLDDCVQWLRKLAHNGIVAFDDYGHDSLPGVFRAVTEYISAVGGFKYLGRFGNKLGVFQRIGVYK